MLSKWLVKDTFNTLTAWSRGAKPNKGCSSFSKEIDWLSLHPSLLSASSIPIYSRGKPKKSKDYNEIY